MMLSILILNTAYSPIKNNHLKCACGLVVLNLISVHHFALDYIKRNFTKLFDLGIHPDCSYLDVFTCNELDECYNTSHLMTRTECKEYRLRCFSYLNSKGIVPSSEEVNLWALKELVFCHYAPYANHLRPNANCGYTIPFFNRIAHDCVIIPWILDSEHDLKLAKINGGIGYCLRDGAYPNVDGTVVEVKL